MFATPLPLLLWPPVVAAALLVVYALNQRVWCRAAGRGRACVVVVGDYGRSPRMQYHTVSLAGVAEKVYVVAYDGSPPCQDVLKRGDVVDLSLLMGPVDVPAALAGLPWVVRAVWKTVVLVLRLPYVMLWRLPKCNVVLLQNPPALPILPVAQLACWVRGMHLVLDWHNLGYTLMQLDNRPPLFVALYRNVEKFFGRGAAHHLCVCAAIKRFLIDDWRTVPGDAAATVMYDKAPAFFKRVGAAGAGAFLRAGGAKLMGTPLAEGFMNGSAWAQGRPALLVSGTSWTVDEDVGLLIAALADLDPLLGTPGYPPSLVMVITGKGGALKDMYLARVAELEREGRFKRTRILTGYLDSFGDYAALLGIADCGVSLHNSSSGLDLPMKVVDMLGTALPVVAFDFPTLAELVTPENGVTFTDRPTLLDALKDTLVDWRVDPADATAATPALERRRAHLLTNPRGDWRSEWDAKVGPVARRLLA